LQTLSICDVATTAVDGWLTEEEKAKADIDARCAGVQVGR